jgi:hypothetical protein
MSSKLKMKMKVKPKNRGMDLDEFIRQEEAKLGIGGEEQKPLKIGSKTKKPN